MTMIDLVQEIINIITFSFVIWILSKSFKFENQKYKSALLTALIPGVFELIVINSYHSIFKTIMPAVLSYLLLFFIYILLVVLIKYFYGVKWSKAFLVGLIGFVIQLIIASIILLIFGVA